MNKKDENTFPNTSASDFYSYVVLEEPNFTSRKTMEDFTISESNLTKDQNWSLFCVLDGHGGSDVALYTKNKYPKILREILLDLKNVSTVEEKIKTSIEQLSTRLFQKKSFDRGSTFCGVLMDQLQRAYYTINIGDSKVLKVSQENTDESNFTVEPLTEEHKVSNKKELKRINQIHKLINKRVGGQLLVTRALGDFSFLQYGLNAQPDIFRYQFSSEKYLIIATDGVWDVIDSKRLAKIVSKNFQNDSNKLARNIVQRAIEKSMDNISLIVISFTPQDRVLLPKLS